MARTCTPLEILAKYLDDETALEDAFWLLKIIFNGHASGGDIRMK